MFHKKFTRISRKIISGDLGFKKYIGNVVEFKKKSYNSFLQMDIPQSERKNICLEKIFKNFFPIDHVKSKMKIEYEGYSISPARMTPEDCVLRGINYGGSFKVFFKITNLQNNEIKKIESVVGEIPLMTDQETFIINGHEKVFVSQMQKTPGIIFSKEVDTSSMKKQSHAKIHPAVGSWIHLKTEKQISVNIDKKKKFGITSFLLCFSKEVSGQNIYQPGYDIKEILDMFNSSMEAVYDDNGFWTIPFNVEDYYKTHLKFNIFYKDKQIGKRGEIVSDDIMKTLEKAKFVKIPFIDIANCHLGEDIYDKQTGEIFCEIGLQPTLDQLDLLKKQGKVKIYEVNNNNPNFILETLKSENITTKDEALNVWADSIKIGSHYGPVGLSWIFNTRFTNKKYYNLGEAGRTRVNRSLNVNHKESYITFMDLIKTIKELILVDQGKRKEDEIDSLINKRFIGIGDILENYFRLGLIKFEKNLKDRIYNLDIDTKRAADLFNLRVCLYLVLDAFYKAAQMHDDNNKLSKTAQLRKINSAGAPGKERIASGLRDTHKSKFGRMCSVQTPEGKKIGIVEHLALYADIDQHGYITTPYHIVTDGKASVNITHLTAFEEEGKIISSKHLYKLTEKDGKEFYEPKSEYLVARDGDQTTFVHNTQVGLINIADNQIFSISASLIPFPGTNDAYRMLSGANMNIQATPLVAPEAPFVGTGMEEVLAEKIIARNSGVVKYVDSSRIVIETNNDSILDFYNLLFNKKTNSETAIINKPLVDIGDIVKKGDLIADGFSSLNGELALGKNLLVAYMSNSYCFEDAIVLNQRIIDEDLLTSIHIQSHSCIVYETRNGPEKNTAEIPRAHPEMLQYLDESGIIPVGTKVISGQILVGKVTPSSKEANVSMEYKLLNIIFGEKASEYTDNSLRLPNGSEGFVSGVRIVTRKGVEKDGRSILEDTQALKKIEKEHLEKILLTKNALKHKLNKVFLSSKIDKKTIIDDSNLKSLIDKPDMFKIEEENIKSIKSLVNNYNKIIKVIDEEKQKKVNTIKFGYELPEGVLKIITVDVASKKVIESGDKLSGRYGNKGVISTVFSRADMPYLEDGTPVDMIMNPCGLLARMNLGQVMETIIGYGILSLQKRLYKLLIDYYNGSDCNRAIRLIKESLNHVLIFKNAGERSLDIDLTKLNDIEVIELANYFKDNGFKVAVEQFKELSNEEIEIFLKNMGGVPKGKVKIFDGKTGEPFFGEILVGYQFILKLCHLVSKKIHARSIGPYSLVNQQPLGGKARLGGQRCGEMEVWALEAHGAAFNCKELLSVKSDDPKQRNRVFSALSRVQKYSIEVTSTANSKIVGESFKLLMYELRAAGFDLFLVDDSGERIKGRL